MGPIAVASQADLARLSSCATLPGVTVRTGAALDLSRLRALTTIAGDLLIGPTVGIDGVRLVELRVVTGAIHVASNGMMQGLFLPRLEHAGSIEIDGNGALTTVSLPRLAAVDGALRVTDNASLEVLDISALASIGQALVITRVPALAVVEAGALHSANTVELDAPKLAPEIAAPLRALRR